MGKSVPRRFRRSVRPGFTSENPARYLRALKEPPNGPDIRQARTGLPAGSARLAEGEPEARDRGRDEGRPERLHAEGAAGRLAEALGQEGLAVHGLAQGIRRARPLHEAEVQLRDWKGEG